MSSWLHHAQSDILVVCFRGLGLTETEQNIGVGYEMPRAATGNGIFNTLFLTDKSESWLNTSGLIEAYSATIASAIADIKPKRVVFLGNSMGAFSAIAMANFIRVDTVLAIAPQWSICPTLVPHEKRWQRQRGRIDCFRIQHVGEVFRPNGHIIALHSDAYAERFQRIPYLALPTVDNWVMTGMRHNVAQELRSRGLLDLLVKSVALDDRSTTQAILSPLAQRQNIKARIRRLARAA